MNDAEHNIQENARWTLQDSQKPWKQKERLECGIGVRNKNLDKWHFSVIVTSSYKAVCDMNAGKGPYSDVTVKKEECVNHIQKRMGTRLQKLRDELKEETTTKSGKVIKRSLVGGKVGKVTDKQIDAFRDTMGNW